MNKIVEENLKKGRELIIKKGKETRSSISARICLYQKNVPYANQILNELWDLCEIRNLVKSTINTTYALYGMDELRPVYKELQKEDLYADAFIGFEEAISSFDNEVAQMEDNQNGRTALAAYVSPFVKSAVVCRILEESKQTFSGATRYYQNNLVKVKKVKCLLEDSNTTIREAILERYHQDWGDSKIDSLREVYTVYDPHDDLLKKKTDSAEDIAFKSNVFDIVEKILKDNGATSKELDIFKKWMDFVEKEEYLNEYLDDNKKLLKTKVFSKEERKLISQFRKILKEKLPKYLNSSLPEKKKTEKRKKVRATIIPFPIKSAYRHKQLLIAEA